MWEEEYSEVSHQSWFSRLRDSCLGIVIGMLLFVAGIPLLFWNEGRAVKAFKTLQEGAGSVISVAADVVDKANDRALVHMTGRAQSESELIDEQFNIRTTAIQLSRKTEMYQWQETKSTETKKNLGGSTEKKTTYRYKKTWKSQVIDSTRFKRPDEHQNPRAIPYGSRTQTAQTVSVGKFRLSSNLIHMIEGSQRLNIPPDARIPDDIASQAHLENGSLYIGNDPGNPEIGDLRISFKIIPSTTVSLVAKQSDDMLIPYRADTGKEIELLRNGSHDAEDMFASAQADNAQLTWILRGAGFLAMLIGLMLIFNPLAVLADVIPILGSLVSTGTFLLSLLLASMFTVGTVGVAWVTYRPVLGYGLLTLAGCVVVCLGMLIFKRRTA